MCMFSVTLHEYHQTCAASHTHKSACVASSWFLYIFVSNAPWLSDMGVLRQALLCQWSPRLHTLHNLPVVFWETHTRVVLVLFPSSSTVLSCLSWELNFCVCVCVFMLPITSLYTYLFVPTNPYPGTAVRLSCLVDNCCKCLFCLGSKLALFLPPTLLH